MYHKLDIQKQKIYSKGNTNSIRLASCTILPSCLDGHAKGLISENQHLMHPYFQDLPAVSNKK